MCTNSASRYHQLRDKKYYSKGRINACTLLLVIFHLYSIDSFYKTLYSDRNLLLQKMSCPKGKKKDDDAEDDQSDDFDQDSGVHDMWQEFLHSLTLHGFRFIFEPGPIFRRVVWLIILSCAISMVFLQSKKSIKKYLSYPITTSVQVEFLEEITFPAVTICNFNLFPYYLINGTIGEKV